MVTSTAKSARPVTLFDLEVPCNPANDATTRAMLEARVHPVDRERVGGMTRDFQQTITSFEA